MSGSITRLITRLFLFLGLNPEPERTPTGDSMESPLEGGTDESDSDRVHVTLYRTTSLNQAIDEGPEQTVARYVAQAFARADIGYRIDFDFDPVDLEDPDIDEFVDSDPPMVAKDANLLLTNNQGGGASFLGGKWGTMGCSRIDRTLAHQWDGERREDGNVHGALHEVLHQLGVGHDMDPEARGMQFPGMTERISRWRWRRTPMAGGTGRNSCDEPIDADPQTPGLITVRVQHYHDCELKSIEIAEGSIP